MFDQPAAPARRGGVLARRFVIALIAYLTLVDLFAAQAILPSLTRAYGVSPAAMSLTVNASTIGMAVAGIAVALFGRRIDRRAGIAVSLALLAVPTALLATMPDLAVFAALRIAQGLCMSAAFTLTMAYLAEHSDPAETAGALAAYITGNVASNLIGRMISAWAADGFGLAGNFGLFAALNLAGAGLAYVALMRGVPMNTGAMSGLGAWLGHFRNGPLRAAFGIGFLILFAFIGTFTFVNFELVRPPLALDPMTLGLVYLVFLPALLTTPFAAAVARRYGVRRTVGGGLLAALAGLPLLLTGELAAVLAGLAAIGCGTFFAQAAATGFIGRAATTERGAASGLYLASYYLGGLVGSLALGQVFVSAGWPATVALLGIALALAALLATRLKLPVA